MILYFAYFLLGVLGGIFTGLIPGIHPNSVLFLSVSLYSYFDTLGFLVFVSGLSVSNTIADFIPSIFIGVPDADTALSVLPGHRLALKGLGYYALKLTIFGAFLSTIFSLVFILLFFNVIKMIYGFLKSYMAWILIFLISFLILQEKFKFKTLLILLFSGIFGILVLNSSLSHSQNIFFPVFSGLFAVPNLLNAVSSQNTIQIQRKMIQFSRTLKGGFLGFLASLFVGFIPGIGSSQSALLMGSLTKFKIRDFMVFVGGINTAGLFLSFVALYLIGRTRTGAAVALQNVLGELTFGYLVYLVGWTLIAVGISSLICLAIGRSFFRWFSRFNVGLINRFALGFLFLGSFVLQGFFGVLVFFVGTSIGILTLRWGVKRGFCMGVLLVPTFLFYLGIGGFLI